MKKVLSLLLAMIMVLSLVACGGNNAADDKANNKADTSTTDKKENTSTDKKEETSAPAGPSRTDIKIPLQSVGASLDPHAQTLIVDIHVTNNVYEGLYRLDPGTG